MLEGRKERAVVLAGLLACIALVASLFLSWYHVTSYRETRPAGGFGLIFSSGSSDAWNTILGTSVLLTCCAVAVGALLLAGVGNRWRPAAVLAVGLALVAAGVIGYRMITSPEIPRGVQGAYFERANSLPDHAVALAAQSGVVPTTTAGGGAVVAVCAAAVAIVAGCALAFIPRPAT